MCIAGFHLENFDAAWPAFAPRAARWGADEAVRIAREQHNSGNGVCMVSDDGLVVLTLETGDNGEDQLFVLMAVSSGAVGAFKRAEPAILLIAEELSAKSVAFKTDRKGWSRLLGPEWTHNGDEFSRGVP